MSYLLALWFLCCWVVRAEPGPMMPFQPKGDIQDEMWMVRMSYQYACGAPACCHCFLMHAPDDRSITCEWVVGTFRSLVPCLISRKDAQYADVAASSRAVAVLVRPHVGRPGQRLCCHALGMSESLLGSSNMHWLMQKVSVTHPDGIDPCYCVSRCADRQARAYRDLSARQDVMTRPANRVVICLPVVFWEHVQPNGFVAEPEQGRSCDACVFPTFSVWAQIWTQPIDAPCPCPAQFHDMPPMLRSATPHIRPGSCLTGLYRTNLIEPPGPKSGNALQMIPTKSVHPALLCIEMRVPVGGTTTGRATTLTSSHLVWAKLCVIQIHQLGCCGTWTVQHNLLFGPGFWQECAGGRYDLCEYTGGNWVNTGWPYSQWLDPGKRAQTAMSLLPSCPVPCSCARWCPTSLPLHSPPTHPPCVGSTHKSFAGTAHGSASVRSLTLRRAYACTFTWFMGFFGLWGCCRPRRPLYPVYLLLYLALRAQVVQASPVLDGTVVDRPRPESSNVEAYPGLQRNSVRKRALLRRFRRQEVRQSIHLSTMPDPEARNRLRVYTYNAGGLDFDRFMSWAEQEAKYDLIVVTETRRQFDAEWSTSTFHCIHSSGKNAGLLILVRSKLVHPNQISWVALTPGRVVHLCLHGTQTLHVLAVYQHAWQTDKIPELLQQRRAVWKFISDTLHGCPPSSMQLCLGDFNCDLPLLPGRVRSAAQPGAKGRAALRQDAQCFADLLEQGDLVALNAQRAWVPTFVGNLGRGLEACTRIDFILLSKRWADMTSKQASTVLRSLHDEHRCGTYHRPVVASIPYARHRRCRTLTTSDFTARDRHLFRKIALQPTGQDRADLQELTNDVRTAPSLDHAMQVMTEFAQGKTRHKLPVAVRRPRLQDDKQWLAFAANMWAHRKAAKRARVTNMRNIFVGWRHMAAFLSASRESRRRAKDRRRDILHTFLTHAHKAHLAHDAHAWYRHINVLCPKEAGKQVHIRDAKGGLLSPAGSLRCIVTYFTALYADPQFTPASIPAISIQDLVAGFRKLPLDKAIRPDLPPAAIWRLLAEPIAAHVHQACKEAFCGQRPAVPRDWDRSRLCLLAKPNKSPNCPANLRPVALQHPITKVITGLLADQAAKVAPEYFAPYPVFAYLKERSTGDCLLAIGQHLRQTSEQVRRLRANRRQTLGQRALHGGLIVTLDLTKAFDSIPRQHIEAAIDRMKLSSTLANLLKLFVAHGEYEVTHRGLSETFSCARGIKQGSKEAPFEWCLATVLILDCMITKYGQTWVQEHLVIYADDFLMRWNYRAIEEFTRATSQAAEVMQTLTSYGLNISLEKSAALMTYTGAGQYRMRKRHIRTVKGTSYLVCVCPDGAAFRLPIVQKFGYLGITISYVRPEKHTLQRRLMAAEYAHKRIRSVLRSFRTHSLKARVALYFQVVWPTLHYGILEIGLPEGGLRKIHVLVLKHIRAIAQSPSHVTHETTEHLLGRLSLDTPSALLQQLWLTKTKVWSLRKAHAASHDIVHMIPEYPATPAFPSAMNAPGSDTAPDGGDAPSPQLSCPQCSASCQTLADLKRHLRSVHKTAKRKLDPSLFLPARDAVPGSWNCAHCGAEMLNRACLRAHIGFSACPSFDPSRSVPRVGLAYSEGIASLRNQGKLRDVLKDSARCQQMTTTCVLCNASVPCSNRMKHHHTTQHVAEFDKAQATVHHLHTAFRGLNRPTKCAHCGAHLQHGLAVHTCPVLIQLAVMLAQPSDEDAGKPGAELASAVHVSESQELQLQPSPPLDTPLPAPLQILMASQDRLWEDRPAKAPRLGPSRLSRRLPADATCLDSPGRKQTRLQWARKLPTRLQNLDHLSTLSHGGGPDGGRPVAHESGGSHDLAASVERRQERSREPNIAACQIPGGQGTRNEGPEQGCQQSATPAERDHRGPCSEGGPPGEVHHPPRGLSRGDPQRDRVLSLYAGHGAWKSGGNGPVPVRALAFENWPAGPRPHPTSHMHADNVLQGAANAPAENRGGSHAGHGYDQGAHGQ